jgi:hypothetical protein
LDEGEHRIILRRNGEWLFGLFVDLLPFVKQIGRHNWQRLCLHASRNAGLVATVSDLASIVLKEASPSLDQKGTGPHRMTVNSRSHVSEFSCKPVGNSAGRRYKKAQAANH